ncbi:hypothetical protein D915_004593 [Fasciola hepatica]|uniref:Uncharacterized protein n=1 Tax=Fasciola hepatica TaxID=6192 RepID=A0A4E0RBK9_FASHE|nr:hypothetical protein D915_004593 [Fasciola hepatica]
MYNFNRPSYPPVNMSHLPVDPMGMGSGFSPRLSSPVGLYQRPPPGVFPDPTFLSPRGDSHVYGSPRFPPPSDPRSSPFTPTARPPFPWPPPISPFSPRFNSPNYHMGSSRDSNSFVGSYGSPQSVYSYDSSQSNYVTGCEPDNESHGSSFHSAQSHRTPNRGRGGTYSVERWRRGNQITRSLSDPWADLDPITTPEPGCLVTNPLVQRHTVLFAPREQQQQTRRRKSDQADAADLDSEDDLPAPKRPSFDM